MITQQNIPIIDLEPLWKKSPEGIQQLAKQIKQAFSEVGFGYIINHSIPQSLIDNMFLQAERFHALPLSEKIKIKQNDCFRGYVPIKASKLAISTEGKATEPNQLDAFVMAFDPDETHSDYKNGLYLSGPNQWPDNLPNFKKTLLEYRDKMLNLSFNLLEAFSIMLCDDRQILQSFFNPPTYFLRLQHYPTQPENIPSDQFGIAPHTDYGFFTLLAQGKVSGLEVRTIDNKWLSVPPIDGALVLNTGDMLKRWSNDTVRSTPHRVINRSDNDRYSIPFFFDPNMHADIEVFDSCINTEHPKKHPSIMYGDYLMDRTQGNYGLGKRNITGATEGA